MNSDTTHKLYTLTCEHRPDYLYAYVEGQHDNYEISRQYWQEVIDECNRAGYSKVLVEEAIEEQSSMIDTFQLVSEFGEMGLRGIKMAFVDRFRSEERRVGKVCTCAG